MIGLRGVIFDLDDTLFDCTGQLTEPARQRASDILCSDLANVTPDELTHLQNRLSKQLGSTGAIREIGARYLVANAMVESALQSYNRDDVPEILPYPDAIETLDSILRANIRISLVTTGRSTRQLAKIERLDLLRYFEPGRNVFIHDPASGNPNKDIQMKVAIEAGLLAPAETACIGDKLDADIRVGNRLGLTTVRIRKGRQRDAEPSTPEETPDFDVLELSELPTILYL
jgi:FMN phosphatase YigB (HAD superfamily)